MLLALLACDDGAAPSAVAPTGCNGHDALCDRAVDAVTFPATHNSMSSEADGWQLANQPHGLVPQLEAGVRGMLIDTHVWEGVAWLCHGYCELGATPLVEGLAAVDGFLLANPREVLVLIVEDGVPADETAAAFDESGLGARVWQGDPADGWPTLGEMIDADQRVIVTAESGGPPPAWYHHAWDLFHDTPYAFSDVSEFSCAHNRGEPDNDLFLVNHWVNDPLPSEENGAAANAHDVLAARVSRCAEETGTRPNLVAVDWYTEGALFQVVAELNGL